MDPASLSILDTVRAQLTEKGQTHAVTEKPKATPAPEPTPAPAPAPSPEPKPAPAPEPKPEPAPAPATVEDDLELSPFSKDLFDEPESAPAPEPKKDDKTEEADELDNLELPKNASESAKDAFKKVNGQRAQLKKELKAIREEKAALEKKLAETNPEESTQKLTAMEEEVKTLRQAKEDYERKIALLDVRETEAWKKMIEEPSQQIKEKADKLAEKYGFNPVALRRSLASADTDALAELMSEHNVNAFDQTELAKIRDKYLDIKSRRENLEAEAKSAKDIHDKATQQQLSAEQEQIRKLYTDTRTQTAGFLKQTFGTFLKEIPGEEEWNTTVKAAVQMMDSVEPSQLSPADMANALSMAAIAPVLAGVVERQRKDFATLVAKYKRLAKIDPTPSSAPAPTPSASKANAEAPISEWVASAKKKAGR